MKSLYNLGIRLDRLYGMSSLEAVDVKLVKEQLCDLGLDGIEIALSEEDVKAPWHHVLQNRGIKVFSICLDFCMNTDMDHLLSTEYSYPMMLVRAGAEALGSGIIIPTFALEKERIVNLIYTHLFRFLSRVAVEDWPEEMTRMNLPHEVGLCWDMGNDRTMRTSFVSYAGANRVKIAHIKYRALGARNTEHFLMSTPEDLEWYRKNIHAMINKGYRKAFIMETPVPHTYARLVEDVKAVRSFF